MKRLFIIVAVLGVLCGCAHNPRSLPTTSSNEPINQQTAILIAKRVVREREKWTRVDCEAQRTDRGWKIFVVPKPIRLVGPMVNLGVDERGQLITYDKWINRM
jgi:hypothetical protein